MKRMMLRPLKVERIQKSSSLKKFRASLISYLEKSFFWKKLSSSSEFKKFYL